MKKDWTSLILVIIFLAGLCLLLYPSISNYWNQHHQTKAVGRYTEYMEELDTKEQDALRKDAMEYNEYLALRGGLCLKPQEDELERYNGLLDVTGTGVMGYVEIPCIRCTLPIYHGTDEGVLEVAVGHLTGTSLPLGGKSTHCVLSGHRGLPSAKLFTNIDKLAIGDLFMLHTLDKTMTYEVDRILIVLPEETDPLRIEQGKDLCTLVTCTPYGVNSHRLLVRGHRVPNVDTMRVGADALQFDGLKIAPLIATPMLIGLFIWLMVTTRKKKENRGDSVEEEG